MNNIEKYCDGMENVKPSEEIIQKVLTEINLRNKKKLRKGSFIRALITFLSTLIIGASSVYASVKIFKLDQKFADIFGVTIQDGESVGLGSEIISNTQKNGDYEVNLSAFLSNDYEMYFALDFESGIDVANIEDSLLVENCKVYKNSISEDNLIEGEIYKSFNSERNDLVVRVCGVEQISKLGKVILTMDIDGKEFSFDTYVNETVENKTYEVNEKIKRNNGDICILKYVKLTPLGMAVLLDVTDNERMKIGENIYDYKDFDIEFDLYDSTKRAIYDVEFQDGNISNQKTIMSRESGDGKTYFYMYVSYDEICAIDGITNIKIGGKNLNIEKLNEVDDSKINVSNYLKSEKSSDSISEKVNSFITSGKMISTSNSVGSGYPEMYFFDNNGKFIYTIGEGYIKEKDTVLSYRGTWKIADGKMNLKINEKLVTVGGNIEYDPLEDADILVNFEKEIKSIEETKTIELNYKKVDGIDYVTFDNEKMYQLSIDEEYSNNLKEQCKNGYEE